MTPDSAAPWSGTRGRGQGVGSALMAPLIERATGLGKHVITGGIDAYKAAALRFHERLGFEPVAHFRPVGFTFGRWLDLVFSGGFSGPEAAAVDHRMSRRQLCHPVHP